MTVIERAVRVYSERKVQSFLAGRRGVGGVGDQLGAAEAGL